MLGGLAYGIDQNLNYDIFCLIISLYDVAKQ